jgi:hypothetical protein
LNQSWHTSLEDARQIIEAWRKDYNTVRPHSSLGYRTPEEYAADVAVRPTSPPRRSSASHRCGSKRMCKNPRVLTYDWSKTGAGHDLFANRKSSGG